MNASKLPRPAKEDQRGGVPIEELTRQDIRGFLEWVHEQAVDKEETNPARMANKSRENLRAVLAWAGEQDIVEALPRFPKQRPHRRVAGRHYLTKGPLSTSVTTQRKKDFCRPSP